MAFTQKLLTADVGLQSGVFSGGGNSASLSGLRMSAHVIDPGGASQALLDMTIYGLPLDMMNQLSTVGTQLDRQQNNTITVQAGDENGMSTIFIGNIFSAYVDAQHMPLVSFRILGRPGVFNAVQPTTPITKQGTVDAATLLQTLAGQAGLTFENNGVSVQLSNPYYAGNVTTQIKEIAQHAGISWSISNGTLAIWNPGASRSGAPIYLAKDSVPPMVRYPAFNSASVIVVSEFNPQFKMGGQIQVQSDLTPACGVWEIKRLEHDLSSMTPHGPWFSIVEGTPTGNTNIA